MDCQAVFLRDKVGVVMDTEKGCDRRGLWIGEEVILMSGSLALVRIDEVMLALKACDEVCT